MTESLESIKISIIFGSIFIFLFVISMILIWILNNRFFKHTILPIENFINNVVSFSKVQLTNDVGRLYRYNLINNLKIYGNMKKYIGWSIILFSLGVIIIASFLVYQSRDFFKIWFDNERQKIELRSEAAVDSLINIISEKETEIITLINNHDTLKDFSNNLRDSLQVKIDLLENTVRNLKSQIFDQKLIITELNDILRTFVNRNDEKTGLNETK